MTLASTIVTITPKYFFVLAAVLFSVGATGLLLRRNTIVMFMCVELMLNAVNLTFVTFAKALDDAAGQAGELSDSVRRENAIANISRLYTTAVQNADGNRQAAEPTRIADANARIAAATAPAPTNS